MRQNFTITFDKDGSHTIVRRDLIRHISGNPPVKSKKIGWITDSFDGYLQKNGKRETEIDFNKEFGIRIFDLGTRTFLTPTTIREPGADYDTLTTTFLFDNPLNENHTDLEYEVTYKLDVSFSFRTFWERQNDSWVTICSAPMAELNVQILLPSDLPADKWRTGDFGHSLVPLNWASCTQDISQGKRRITIAARNLEAGEYKCRIDARV